jgi:hypothetical protein
MTVSSTQGAAPPAGPPKLVEVKLSAAWDRAYAGVRLPVTFDLSRPAPDPRALRLQRITSDDTEVQLDADLLQPEVEIRPGETYRFTVGLSVLRPKLFDLAALNLVFGHGEPGKDQVSIPIKPSTQKLIVKPAISREVKILLETLCAYQEGTKVLLTLRHDGGTHFKELELALGPAAAIRAGKSHVLRASFAPGDEEQLELVLAGSELDLTMTANIDGQRPEAHQTLRVEPPVPPSGRRFRFLEPRRLARDRHRIDEILGEGHTRAVPEQRGVYLLEGGCQYRVEILPMQPNVSDVKLNEITGLLQVRKREKTGHGGWVFTVDVTAHHLLRKPDRLFYEMDTPEGKLTGEIPICLKQSSWRFWQVAAALGAATTIQGGAALGRYLSEEAHSLVDVFARFDPAKHLSVLFLLSIPAAWVGLRFLDWLQYQFRG